MEETTVSIIGILVAALLMYIVPLILISERADDISQLLVQTVTAEFVDEVIKSGEITEEKYRTFIRRLSSSGNAYDIEMEVKILDENTAKFYTNKANEVVTNTYYSIYTSQIEQMLGESSIDGNNQGRIILKQGDSISVTVKNSSKTMSQTLKNFYHVMRGANIQIITATAFGTVAIDGATA